jgi:hypothetical protein
LEQLEQFFAPGASGTVFGDWSRFLAMEQIFTSGAGGTVFWHLEQIFGFGTGKLRSLT